MHAIHRARPMLVVVIGLIAATAAVAQPARASEGLSEKLVTVPLSRGGELPLVVSRRTGTRPTIAVLLFPGYPGVLRIRDEDGAIRFELAGNFLVRARRFLNTEQTFTVLVDCPRDEWHRCGDAYRSSREHVADIADVVETLRSTHAARQVYIVGTSYGTLSSSFLARGLAGRIDGAVHTATMTDPRGSAQAHGLPMGVFDWSRTTLPQLFVHHRDDPCDVTRYASIERRRQGLPLITVEGAGETRGGACEAFTQHGFVGRERAVMTAIGAWIVDRRLTPTIGDP